MSLCVLLRCSLDTIHPRSSRIHIREPEHVLESRSRSPTAVFGTLFSSCRPSTVGIMAIHLASRCVLTPFGMINSPFELGAAFAKQSTIVTDQLSFDCPVVLRYFVERCCSKTPESRPRIQELIEAARAFRCWFHSAFDLRHQDLEVLYFQLALRDINVQTIIITTVAIGAFDQIWNESLLFL